MSTITGADEIKWNEMNEMSVEKWWNEICDRGKREKPREKPTRLHFVHHETHMDWPRCELGTAGVGGERLTACATRSLREKILERCRSKLPYLTTQKQRWIVVKRLKECSNGSLHTGLKGNKYHPFNSRQGHQYQYQYQFICQFTLYRVSDSMLRLHILYKHVK